MVRPFEDVFSNDDVEQRIYGTILQTREPTTASAIADSADCDPKTARKYLSWFEDLGIVTRHDGHPATTNGMTRILSGDASTSSRPTIPSKSFKNAFVN